MTQVLFKFGTNDLVRFIKIYRKHECLWDTENVAYKNRISRIAALKAFAKEFGVHSFGPREVTVKIKSIRTQYQSEKKKIKDSIQAGLGEIYTSRLPWYNLIDSFLRKNSDAKEKVASTNDNPQDMAIEHVNVDNLDDTPKLTLNYSIEDGIQPDTSNTTIKKASKRRCIRSVYSEPEKRWRMENSGEDLETFGKYVASSLRLLKLKNCIYAQDEIQRVLSKYKLKNIENDEEITSKEYLKLSSDDE